MHNKSTLALITFILASILAGSALAQVSDFDFLASSKSLDICMCGSDEVLFKIKNPTGSSEGYLISTSGPGKELAELPFSYVTLKPGAEIDVPVPINALCREKGDRELRVKATSDSGLVKQINVDINTKNCVNIGIRNPEYKQDSCQCQATVFEFNLSNPGVFRETYYISVEEFKNFTLMSANTVTIDPGSWGKIFVQVSPPCNVVGLQNLTLIIKAKNSGFVARKPYFLNIKNCYDFTFNAGGFRSIYDAEGNYLGRAPSDDPQENYTACSSETTRIPLLLENIGASVNNYTVSMGPNVPSWVSLDLNDSITLARNATARFDLVLNPPEGETFEGNITLLAQGSIAGGQKQAQVPLTLEDCYGFSIEFIDQANQVCCFPNQLRLNLTNTGSFEETFSMSLDGPEWASFSSSQLSVPANESRTLDVLFQPPCDLNSQETITVTSTLEKQSINLTSSASTSFEVVDINSCQQAEIEDLQFLANSKANTYYGDYEIPLKIYNKGIRPANYILTLEAPEWMRLEPDIIGLGPGAQAVVLLKTQAPPDAQAGAYDIAVIAEPDDSEAQYRQVFSIRLKEYSAWDQAAHSFDQYAFWYVLGFILLIVFVMYLVLLPKKKKASKDKAPVYDIEEDIFKQKPKEKAEIKQKPQEVVQEVEEPQVEVYQRKKSSPWKVWVSILVVVLVLAGITGYLISLPPGETLDVPLESNESLIDTQEPPEQPPENDTGKITEEELPIESFTYMLFNEDETRVINLNDHFYDPDADQLTFGFTETENFEVNLDEGRVSLTPQEGFVGEEEIVFFAQDEQGGRISSPPVTLRALEGSPIEREPDEMLPEEEASPENSLNNTVEDQAEVLVEEQNQPGFRTYLFYIILGIVILIVIVLILELSSRGKKKDNDEPSEIDLEEELEKK